MEKEGGKTKDFLSRLRKRRMTDKELKKLLSGIQYIPNEGERDELTQIILKAASESLTLKKLKQISVLDNKCSNG